MLQWHKAVCYLQNYIILREYQAKTYTFLRE